MSDERPSPTAAAAPDEDIRSLLVEIRDTAREHLALYRQLAERSLQTQDAAVRMQRRATRLYQGVVVVAALIVLVLLGLALGLAW